MGAFGKVTSQGEEINFLSGKIFEKQKESTKKLKFLTSRSWTKTPFYQGWEGGKKN